MIRLHQNQPNRTKFLVCLFVCPIRPTYELTSPHTDSKPDQTKININGFDMAKSAVVSLVPPARCAVAVPVQLLSNLKLIDVVAGDALRPAQTLSRGRGSGQHSGQRLALCQVHSFMVQIYFNLSLGSSRNWWRGDLGLRGLGNSQIQDKTSTGPYRSCAALLAI